MTENSANSVEQVGNTKQPAASKRWCFTFNNYTEKDYILLKNTFSAKSISYIIGKEVGEEGTPHLQGYIEAKKRLRWSEFKLPKAIHWEKCKGSRIENLKYCSKDRDYDTSGFAYIPVPLKILKDEQLYTWQKKIVQDIKQEPDDRTIHWYWEPNGKMGKTTFCKYLAHNYAGVLVGGKKADVLFNAANCESNLYLFDFVRSMEEYISYDAIESIKNGHYFCSKYESKTILRNSPHIYIFANFPPDLTKLSKDRWKVIQLKKSEGKK